MPSSVTENNLAELTPHIMNILDQWRLDGQQILTILGLKDKVRSRQLQKYRNQHQLFPWDEELAQRIEHIIGIEAALRTTYPFNKSMATLWLRKPHQRFKQRPPLEYILHEGLDGLRQVRIEVDCSYDWNTAKAILK